MEILQEAEATRGRENRKVRGSTFCRTPAGRGPEAKQEEEQATASSTGQVLAK